jgi:hypothetical protein
MSSGESSPEGMQAIADVLYYPCNNEDSTVDFAAGHHTSLWRFDTLTPHEISVDFAPDTVEPTAWKLGFPLVDDAVDLPWTGSVSEVSDGPVTFSDEVNGGHRPTFLKILLSPPQQPQVAFMLLRRPLQGLVTNANILLDVLATRVVDDELKLMFPSSGDDPDNSPGNNAGT